MTQPSFRVEGAERLRRKLQEAGPKARAAARRGNRKAAAYAVKMLRWTAPQQPGNPKSTGATKKALGAVATRRGNEDGMWIGIRRDFKFTVHTKKRGGEYAKRVKKNQDTGGMVTKQPATYAYAFEKMKSHSWFYPTWRKISGQVKNTMVKEIYNEVDKLKQGV